MNPQTVELRQDHTISRIIKGGWQLAGDHGEVDPDNAIRDMEAFLDAGITTFDCADIYNGVEEMIGRFIADIRRRRGRSVADRVIVHTKLVPDLGRLADLQVQEVEAIIDRSLKRLQIERIHLVQFFWWDLSLGHAESMLAVLKHCQDKGKIRHLGVNNWDSAEIGRFVDADFDIVSAQVQYSILDRRPENNLSGWAANNNIQLLCYGTLAGGFLTETWLDKPDPGFAFKNRSLVKYRLIVDEFGPWSLFQELLAVLKTIADKHGVSLAAVASRWVLDRPNVAAAIVGARYAGHLPKTLEVFDLKLDDNDAGEIERVIQRSRGPEGLVYGLEKNRTGRHGSIMKYNLNTNPDDEVLVESQNNKQRR